MKNKNAIARTNRMRVLIMALVLAIGVIFIWYGIAIPRDSTNAVSIIVLTFGTTFVASAIISFIMLMAGFMDLKENAAELASMVGDSLGMPCAARFNLVDSAGVVGLNRVYIDRETALQKQNFCREIDNEEDEIFIVGSSLLGLLKQPHFAHVATSLKERVENNVVLNIMLTHPLFADFRAAQEGRIPQDIGKEIVDCLDKIVELFGKDNPCVSVYLYRGTPTIFGICTRNKMLINPYPYGKQAYESPCFEFDSNTNAYSCYQQTHFQIRFMHKIEKVKDIRLVADNLRALIPEFSSEVGKFEAMYPMKEVVAYSGPSEPPIPEEREQ